MSIPAILIVDNEPLLLEIVERWLKMAGFEVATARCLEEARAHLAGERRFAAILLDWHLAGSTSSGGRCEFGGELLAELAERAVRIPVLVMSGNPSIDAEAEAYRAGAVAFLSKPLQSAVLVAALQSVLLLGAECLFPKVARVEDLVPLEKVKELYACLVLERCEGNLTLAAEKLGVHRQTAATLTTGWRARRRAPLPPVSSSAPPPLACLP
jgi:ActR/RegA family two-component response regulator